MKSQDFLTGVAGSNHANDHSNRYPHPADAWLTPHDSRVKCNSLKWSHSLNAFEHLFLTIIIL